MEAVTMDPRGLIPNPWNSNKVSEDNMAKLKRSIQDLGFAGAVVVRELEGSDGYQILGGQHRTEAAIELGMDKIPVVNVGVIGDVQAKKISLVDNHRFGNDDVIQLAKVIEDIGEEVADLVEIMPVSTADIEAVLNMVDLDLDNFDLELDDEDDKFDAEEKSGERPLKTHEVVKFRLTMANAEAVRQKIEKTIRREGFDDNDEMSNAGDALAHLLLTED